MTSRQLVRAARVANATTDGWLADAAIEVVDGRIASVGRAGELPTDIATTHEIHDLGDVSLLPGFVETHIHMHFPADPDYRAIARPEPVERLAHPSDGGDARPAAVRCDDRARHRQPAGRGPRDPVGDGGRRHRPGRACWWSGRRSRPPAGHYWFLGGEADTTDAVIARIREAKKAGVDAIKLMASGGGYTPTSNPRSQQYDAATLAAATAEAHRLGLPVLAHSLTAVSNARAADAGIDTIIHGGVWWTDYPVRDQAYAYDPAVADRIAARGIWVDPTIGEVELHEAHDAAGGPALPAFEHWALPDVPSELEPRLGFMRDMADRGVRFIGGMGMGMPIVTFDSVACSAQVYARLLGFDPWRAIRTITCDAAEALGLAGVTGAIRPGLAADLVAVEGDPIAGADGPGGHAGLGGLRRVRDVIQGGRPVVRDGQALV